MFQILKILLGLQLYNVASCSTDIYSKFQQNDYKLEFTRLELVNYNEDIYKKLEVVTFKYNRSLAVVNGSFQLQVQLNCTKIDVVIQAYKFLSNEYRIYPIRFQLNVCRLISQNIAGAMEIIRRCGNITSCHFKKGVLYHVCNVYPDQSKFPPFIPNGEYKIELTLVYGNVTLGVLNGYGKVYRPIV